MRNGDLEQASRLFRALTEQFPDFPIAWSNLGCALQENRAYEEAQKESAWLCPRPQTPRYSLEYGNDGRFSSETTETALSTLKRAASCQTANLAIFLAANGQMNRFRDALFWSMRSRVRRYDTIRSISNEPQFTRELRDRLGP